MDIKDVAAMGGKARAKNMTDVERSEHAKKMVEAREAKKLQVQHLPSDYPPSDEKLMELNAEQEAKHGEERVSTNE